MHLKYELLYMLNVIDLFPDIVYNDKQSGEERRGVRQAGVYTWDYGNCIATEWQSEIPSNVTVSPCRNIILKS